MKFKQIIIVLLTVAYFTSIQLFQTYIAKISVVLARVVKNLAIHFFICMYTDTEFVETGLFIFKLEF